MVLAGHRVLDMVGRALSSAWTRKEFIVDMVGGACRSCTLIGLDGHPSMPPARNRPTQPVLKTRPTSLA